MRIALGLAGWFAAAVLVCGQHAAIAAADNETIRKALRECEQRMADNREEARRCYIRVTGDQDLWGQQEAVAPLEKTEPPRNAAEIVNAREKGPDTDLEGWATQKIRDVMESNMDLNYVTPSNGLRFSGDKTPSDILYEAQIFENFSIYRPSSTNSASPVDVWFDLPVRIQLRQLTDNWKPVYTPSYNPGLRFMLAPKADFQPANMLTYYSLGIHHYSNGQGPPPGLPDKDPLDTTTQKFNTNYVEAAAYLVMGQKTNDNYVNDFPWARVSFKQQFYGTWVPQMIGQYPRRSLTLEFRTPEMPAGCGQQQAEQRHCWRLPLVPDDFGKTQFRLASTYNSGYGDVVIDGADLSQSIPARFSDKLNTTAELLIRPTGFKQLWLYMRYDHGYDYYNINFQHPINRLQFGVAAMPY
jgi:hypothetical protein